MGTYKATVEGLSLLNDRLEGGVEELTIELDPKWKIQFQSGIQATGLSGRRTIRQQVGFPSEFRR